MRNYALYEYFFYTRLERNAAIALTASCLLALLAPVFFPFFMKNEGKTDFTDILHAASLATEKAVAMQEAAPSNRRRPDPPALEIEHFVFDPNTATKEEFVRLGLAPRTAQTILNFRAKGGKFHKKEDLEKIYGLRKEDYARLLPWVRIEAPTPGPGPNTETTETQPAGTQPGPKNNFQPRHFPPEEAAPVFIDVNTATAEAWQQLRGIGPGYSKRIVNFREKLGGFASVDQVGETYGLPDSTFQKIRPYLQASPIFRKINVNTASLEELKAHPYLSSFQATVLFNYRQQHGPFAGLEGLKKVSAGFESKDWERLEAYFVFE